MFICYAIYFLMSALVNNMFPLVRKFSGVRPGDTSCDLDVFLANLDAYFESHSFLDDADRLRMAKKLIDPDPSIGDISLYTSTHKYSTLRSYEDFKAYLRKAYPSSLEVGSSNYLHSPRSNSHSTQHSNVSLCHNTCVLPSAQSGQYSQRPYSQKVLSQFVSNPALQNVHGSKFIFNSNLSNVRRNFQSAHKQDFRQVRRSSQSFSTSSFLGRCYNCNRVGHKARFCNTEYYCSFHHSNSHSTKTCRARKAQNLVSSQNQNTTHQTHCSVYSKRRRTKSYQYQVHSRRQKSVIPQSSTPQLAYMDFSVNSGHTFCYVDNRHKNSSQFSHVLATPTDMHHDFKFRPLYLADAGLQKAIVIFLDSGSPKNIMTERAYEAHFSSLPLLPVSNGVLTGIAGDRLSILGQVEVSFNLGRVKVKELVWVVGGIQLFAHILLGYPTMAKYRIHIQPEKDRMVIGSGHSRSIVPRFPMELHYSLDNSSDKDNTSQHSHGQTSILKNNTSHLREIIHRKSYISYDLDRSVETDLCLSRNIRLNPNESVWVDCTVDPLHEDKDLITLPETTEVHGISISSGIHRVIQGKVCLELSNHRASKLSLQEHMPIAKAEVYVVPVIPVEEEHDVTESERRKSLPDYPPGPFGEDSMPLSSMGNVSSDAPNSSRYEKILDSLKDVPESVPKNIKGLLADLLSRYSDVVALDSDSLGKTDLLRHKIDIPPDARPVYIPAYRVAYSQKNVIDREVKKMLKDGIIEPSRSPWSFPLLVVPKKDKTHRLVVDFRRLNKITRTDPYPMPSMKDLISSIGSKKYFTTIDLLQGFLQIPLDEESKEFTAFSSASGRFQYTRMPFGLKSAPVSFVRLMDMVLGDLLGKNLHCYIDDLIIATDTLDEHLKLLDKVLHRLKSAGLKLKLKKCSFMKEKIVYLGHTISEHGVEVNDLKIQAIQNYPIPTSKKEVKSFLGLAGFYRMFVKDFAKIAAPLTALLKDDADFIWSSAQQQAFEALQAELINPPVLRFPDFAKEFFIVTDACDIGIGSCLMQLHEGKYHPIAYHSRKLKPAEMNYSVTDRESLAVIDALRHFRYIIFGAKITIFTDHMAAVELLKNPSHSGRRARWFLTAQDYEITLKHIRGSKNVVADALSRNPVAFTSVQTQDNTGSSISFPSPGVLVFNYTDELSREVFQTRQGQDEALSRIIQAIKSGSPIDDRFERDVKATTGRPFKELGLQQDILIWRSTEQDSLGSVNKIVIRKIVPKSLIPKVLELMHDNPVRAHPGRDETLRQIKEVFHWKGLYSDVQKYIKECNICNAYKGSTDKNVPLGQYPIPTAPFERVAIDLITNLSPTRRDNKVLLVCVDQLTRFTELIPLQRKTGSECALALFNNIFCRYSSPQLIISDNGPEFNNEMMKVLCERFQVEKTTILPYHPASNGLVERANRKILEVLRTTIGQEDPQWDLHLPMVQYSLNSRIHASTKVTPIQALMGYKPRLPYAWLNEPVSPVYNDNPVRIRLNNFKVIHQKLSQNLRDAQLEMVEKHNNNIQPLSYHVNDDVYIKNDVRSGINYKLDRKFTGPCKVLEVSDLKVRIRTPNGKETWVNKDKVKKIDTVTADPPSVVQSSPEVQPSSSSQSQVDTPAPHDQHAVPGDVQHSVSSDISKKVRFNDQPSVHKIPHRYNLRCHKCRR